MKIAIVCYPTFGGSGVVATELGLALADRGHEVHFITYRQPVRLDVLNSSIHFHEVSVPDYPLFHYQPYALALSSKMVEIVKTHGIELMHVHYAIPHAYAAHMAKLILGEEGIHLPVVTTLHGTDVTLVGKHPVYKPAVTFSINQSDCVTSVSESLKQDTQSIFAVAKDIHVIPNFVDFSKHKNHSKNCQRDLIAADDVKIVTHVSNFRKVKRVQDVIEVFYRIQQNIKAQLILVGDGPERLNCMQLCDDLNIQDQVKFMGMSNEVYTILCYSDLFLLPSASESFGLAALEAMMMRVPVISSNTGGLPEVNIDGKSGYLFPVGAIDAMAEKAIELLSDDALLEQFKSQAFHIAQGYDIKKVVNQYLSIYSQTLKKAPYSG